MTKPLDDRTPGQKTRQPTLQQLASRKHQAERGGRLGRMRSWQTIVVGIVTLAVLALWIATTR